EVRGVIANRWQQLVLADQPGHELREIPVFELVLPDQLEAAAREVAARPVILVIKDDAHALAGVIGNAPDVLVRCLIRRRHQRRRFLPSLIGAYFLGDDLLARSKEDDIQAVLTFRARSAYRGRSKGDHARPFRDDESAVQERLFRAGNRVMTRLPARKR